VTNGAALAGQLGVREELIGLTLIAVGTSLPELATVVAAAFHKKSDVAMGSVVGSNIFNLLAVGGVAGLAGGAEFGAASLRIDIPAMIGVALLASAFIFLRRDVGRVSGVGMVAAYVAFVVVIAVNAG
jgi:cation:H+ antiporter